MTARVEEHAASVEVHGLTLAAPVWCVVLRCDECDAVHVVEGDDVRGASDAAAALGWTYDGGERDGCPLHPVGEGARP